MDAKITKKRLSKLFSYEWVKILAIAIAVVFGWLVIFEFTETRIKPSQKFIVFNHMANNSFKRDSMNAIENLVSEGVFSAEVLKSDYQDLKTAGMYSHTTLESYLGVSDGDVIVVPNLTNPKASENVGGSGDKGKYTYPESLIAPYRPYMRYLDDDRAGGYFYELKAYLNKFYTQGWEKPESIDKAKIEAEFRIRAEKTRDKRYRTKKRMQAGIAGEIDRIEKYRDALEKFYVFLDEGLIAFNAPSKIAAQPKDGQEAYEGILSLNICPDESKMAKLKYYFSYTDEARETSKATKDMSVVFFYNPDQTPTVEYEALLYVVDLIEKSKTL